MHYLTHGKLLVPMCGSTCQMSGRKETKIFDSDKKQESFKSSNTALFLSLFDNHLEIIYQIKSKMIYCHWNMTIIIMKFITWRVVTLLRNKREQGKQSL